MRREFFRFQIETPDLAARTSRQPEIPFFTEYYDGMGATPARLHRTRFFGPFVFRDLGATEANFKSPPLGRVTK